MPVIKAGEYASGRKEWRQVFSDNFPGTKLNTANWNIEKMHDALNRAGNEGLIVPGQSVEGRRWAAFYNDYFEHTIRVNNGLHLGCHVIGKRDRQRFPFNANGVVDDPKTHDGEIFRPDLYHLYLGWVCTSQRLWDESEGQHIVDPNKPARTFRYGAFQTVVNFGSMFAEGVRLSSWLTATHDEHGGDVSSLMYSDHDDDADKLECDCFENEWGPAGKKRNVLMVKNISGDRYGSTPNGEFDLIKLGIDLHDGQDHVILHVWEPDGHHWYVDGWRVNYDFDRVMQVFATWNLSREANAGVVAKKDEWNDWPVADHPRLPLDPGLWHTNVWGDLAKAQESVGIIKSAIAWEDRPAMRQVPGVDLPPDLKPEPGMKERVEGVDHQVGDVLDWDFEESETKWNVYLNGRYVTTVEVPEYRVEAAGNYSVEEYRLEL